eukprot:SAG31_NODE_31672_length_365_cov_1.150376_2_plen_47_part_01
MIRHDFSAPHEPDNLVYRIAVQSINARPISWKAHRNDLIGDVGQVQV